jgi:hypothetical protein
MSHARWLLIATVPDNSRFGGNAFRCFHSTGAALRQSHEIATSISRGLDTFPIQLTSAKVTGYLPPYEHRQVDTPIRGVAGATHERH